MRQRSGRIFDAGSTGWQAFRYKKWYKPAPLEPTARNEKGPLQGPFE